MINWAIRYVPILHILQQTQPPFVLDVGSGPEGLQLFWSGRVVGVDYVFKRQPLHEAVRGSCVTLPVASRSCPVVVCCDTLEHIAPEQRHQSVLELARVAQQKLLLVFPSGPEALKMYQQLAVQFGATLPIWLHEHIAYGLPDAEQVASWLQQAGWQVTLEWYESIAVHQTLLKWERFWLVKLVTYSLMRLFGRWLAPRLLVPMAGSKLRVLLHAIRST